MEILSMTRLDERMIAELEALCAVCRDAGETAELETNMSLNAIPRMPGYFFAREGGELLGAASIFAPTRREAEIGALVRPDSRRRGVFSALRAEAEGILRGRGYGKALYVVEGDSAAGRATAAAMGAPRVRSEYTMIIEAEKARERSRVVTSKSALEVERIGLERLDELVELRSGEFGDSREEAEAFERATFAGTDRRVYAGISGGRMVAACSLGMEAKAVCIYGLVVDRLLRGRGLGSAFLDRVLAIAGDEGRAIMLEVDEENEIARRLYAKAGFKERGREDYYLMRLV